jgi:hypothetical protein
MVLSGLILGLVGSLIDFVSGSLILTQGVMTTNQMGVTMNEYDPYTLAWGIAIFVLGAVLLITAFASISSTGMRRMDLFGVLMSVYGVVMIFIGGAMYSRLTTVMQGSFLTSLAMFSVGVLMVLNGILMRRSMGQR